MNHPVLTQSRVDRHTPRNRAQRRSFSSPEDQAPSTGKKIKLEAEGGGSITYLEVSNVTGLLYCINVLSHTGDTKKPQALRASNLSAAWPSVIFSSHTATRRPEEEETGEAGENEEVEENEQVCVCSCCVLQYSMYLSSHPI